MEENRSSAWTFTATLALRDQHCLDSTFQLYPVATMAVTYHTAPHYTAVKREIYHSTTTIDDNFTLAKFIAELPASEELQQCLTPIALSDELELSSLLQDELELTELLDDDSSQLSEELLELETLLEELLEIILIPALTDRCNAMALDLISSSIASLHAFPEDIAETCSASRKRTSRLPIAVRRQRCSSGLEPSTSSRARHSLKCTQMEM